MHLEELEGDLRHEIDIEVALWCRTFMTIVNVTEEAAEKARQWNWSIPKLISNWLDKNEVSGVS